eukprot:GHVN01069709.1.p1 GENE.GHVN01069709.1~~GHVN01069709.1.p1  ORF type:complete len:1202 (+),score=273.20 GHVN01069709.1:504-3608(+)
MTHSKPKGDSHKPNPLPPVPTDTFANLNNRRSPKPPSHHPHTSATPSPHPPQSLHSSVQNSRKSQLSREDLQAEESRRYRARFASTAANCLNWTVDEVSTFVAQIGLSGMIRCFTEHQVSGAVLAELVSCPESNLIDIGITDRFARRHLSLGFQLLLKTRQRCGHGASFSYAKMVKDPLVAELEISSKDLVLESVIATGGYGKVFKAKYRPHRHNYTGMGSGPSPIIQGGSSRSIVRNLISNKSTSPTNDCDRNRRRGDAGVSLKRTGIAGDESTGMEDYGRLSRWMGDTSPNLPRRQRRRESLPSPVGKRRDYGIENVENGGDESEHTDDIEKFRERMGVNITGTSQKPKRVGLNQYENRVSQLTLTTAVPLMKGGDDGATRLSEESGCLILGSRMDKRDRDGREEGRRRGSQNSSDIMAAQGAASVATRGSTLPPLPGAVLSSLIPSPVCDSESRYTTHRQIMNVDGHNRLEAVTCIPVAVKIFRRKKNSDKHASEASVARDFYSELQVLSRLRHPNVTLMFGVVLSPSYAIVTEYVRCGSLFDMLHRYHNKLTLPQVVRLAKEIAYGMAYLHTNGVLHCDLKSSNILLTPSGSVKICDFGLATVCDDDSERNKATSGLPQMLGCVGTHHWMAPEVLRGEGFTMASDVYSFGMILWEMLTREIPYRGMPVVHIFAAVGYSSPPVALPYPLPHTGRQVSLKYESYLNDGQYSRQRTHHRNRNEPSRESECQTKPITHSLPSAVIENSNESNGSNGSSGAEEKNNQQCGIADASQNFVREVNGAELPQSAPDIHPNHSQLRRPLDDSPTNAMGGGLSIHLNPHQTLFASSRSFSNALATADSSSFPPVSHQLMPTIPSYPAQDIKKNSSRSQRMPSTGSLTPGGLWSRDHSTPRGIPGRVPLQEETREATHNLAYSPIPRHRDMELNQQGNQPQSKYHHIMYQRSEEENQTELFSSDDEDDNEGDNGSGARIPNSSLSPLPADIPPPLKHLFEICVNPNPKLRPSFASLANRLDKLPLSLKLEAEEELTAFFGQ